MNTYFRITAYYPAQDISFIIDSINQYEEIWQFSAKLVSMKCKILAVSEHVRFDDSNIPKAVLRENNLILRACSIGKIEVQNNTVCVNNKYYKIK